MNPPVSENHNPPPISLLGILDSGWEGFTHHAQQRLRAAELVLGASRTLALVQPHVDGGVELRSIDGHFGEVGQWLQQALQERRRTVVLATGDPLFHGIGKLLLGLLGEHALEILPAPSTYQLAFARLKRPWQDAALISLHGGDYGEWQPGASADHGCMPLLRAAQRHNRIACLTAPANTPARIARTLLAAGMDGDFLLSVAARLEMPDEALWRDLSLQEAASMEFPEPNVVVLERIRPLRRTASFGLPDESYVQRHPEKGLITKLEVRAVSLAHLELKPDSIVWDIGAGSGSVGLEAARLAPDGHVHAVEKNLDDVANARHNARQLGLINYSLHHAKAPQGLEHWPDPDAVFIGGSGGELASLIELIRQRLKPQGRLVMNFVTFENLITATTTLTASDMHWEVTQLQASRSQPILGMHRLAAQNPVWIVTARHKESPCATAN